MSDSALTVVVVFPDLLGTYGDGGNGVVLARRAAWRGIPVELVESPSDRPLPTGDLYCLGGGEDGPQVRAATTLRVDGTLARAVDRWRGRCSPSAPGTRSWAVPSPGPMVRPGTRARAARRHHGQGGGRRAVGEVLAEPIDNGPALTDGGPGLPTLTGFENHGGGRRRTGAQPLARVDGGRRQRRCGGPRARGRVGWWAPTCMARCWPATRPWPTCCSRGLSTT